MADKVKITRGKVVLLLVLTTLVITVLVLLFSFNLIHDFERRITAQSVEFSLQLIASVTEKDFLDLSSLVLWCSRNSDIIDYLLAEEDSGLDLIAWRWLLEQHTNNRNGFYIRRIIVFDSDMEKFLQVGNLIGGSEPLSVDNLGKIFDTGIERNSQWRTLIQDPYSSDNLLLFPLLVPVLNPDNGDEIGIVFIAVTPGIIINELNRYQPPEDSSLYLSLGNEYFLIDDSGLRKVEFPYLKYFNDSGSSDRTVLSFKDEEGKRLTLIRQPIWGEMAFIQIYPEFIFSPFRGALVWLILGFGILLLLLGFMAWGVNRMTKELTDSAIIMKKLENSAYIDALTGLYNRKHFTELAHANIASAERQNQPVYSAMLDLDYFKKVNDVYGHAGGDMVLKVTAETIHKTIRSYDLLGRYGGEEFVLLITNIKEWDVFRLMNRIRENIEHGIVNYEDKEIKVTCSIGLAKFTETDTLDTAIKSADEALYAAKNAGRNQVKVYGSDSAFQP